MRALMARIGKKWTDARFRWRIWRRAFALALQMRHLTEMQMQRAEWLIDSERDATDHEAESHRYIRWLTDVQRDRSVGRVPVIIDGEIKTPWSK